MSESMRARLLGGCGYFCAVLSVYGLIATGLATALYVVVIWLGAKSGVTWSSVAALFALGISTAWILVIALVYTSYNLLLGHWIDEKDSALKSGRSKIVVLRNVFVLCCIGSAVWFANYKWCNYRAEHFADGIVIPPGMVVEQVSFAEQATLSKRRHSPQLKVVSPLNSNVGGVYQVIAATNSGEDGQTYLKVFEAVRNIPLSEPQLSRGSMKRVGWSEDKGETFLYSADVDIHEGVWNKPYPARFELWFRPDDRTKPERKLLERIYSIYAAIQGL